MTGACLSQVSVAIRSTEAEKQTKMLFEITCQNFFRDCFRPDEQNYIGSVAGLGAIAPLEIRPLSLSGSAWAVSVSVVCEMKALCKQQASEKPSV